MKSRLSFRIAFWALFGLACLGSTVSCIVPIGEGRRGYWHGGGEWRGRG
jgi:hypothetical protein